MEIALTPTAFIDNKVLDPTRLNRALYSTEPGRGLYSEPNGGIENLRGNNNFSSEFRLRQEHMQPEQVMRSRFSGDYRTLDNMSDVSGRTTRVDDLSTPRQQALPGVGLRVYAPFEATAIRWNVSWFWYAARWFGLDVGEDISSTSASIETFVFVDDFVQPALQRAYPMTWFGKQATDQSAAGTSNRFKAPYSTEAEQASVMNLSHLQTVAADGAPDAKLERGFHEVFVGFYVKPLDIAIQRNDMLRYDREVLIAVKELQMYQRFSVGCRGARVVAYR